MDYKEKLELARDWYNDQSTTKKEKVLLENLFPELKESEDERIRKEVEKAAKDWYKENYEGENPQGKALMISAYIDGAIAWLEKQGEQKETPCDRCKKAQPYHSCQDITELGRCYLELEKAMKGE